MLANSHPGASSRVTLEGFEIAFEHVDPAGEFALSLERPVGGDRWTIELEQPGILDVSGATRLSSALAALLDTAAREGITTGSTGARA